IRVVTEMLRNRRKNSTFDGLVYRDQLEQGPDGLVRSVVVERVEPGSPGATAGLARGDVLTQVNGVRIDCAYDVERALLDRSAGDKVGVMLRRQSAEQRTDLVLAAPDAARP